MAKIKIKLQPQQAPDQEQPEPTREKQVAHADNREEWLMKGVDLMGKMLFSSLPEVRVSVGWPHGRPGAKPSETWDSAASTDGRFQIFISPTIDDGQTALVRLAHEIVHCKAGDVKGHGPFFGRIADSIGFGKPYKDAIPEPGGRLDALLEIFLAKLGPYPHARLEPEKSGQGKQTTRLVKCVCPASGYTVRTTRTWLEQYGPPISPATLNPMTVEETV